MKVAASIAGGHGGGPHRAKLVHVQRQTRGEKDGYGGHGGAQLSPWTQSDDGKRLQACLKRLELLSKAKPKIGGCQGEAPGGLGAQGYASGFQSQPGYLLPPVSNEK